LSVDQISSEIVGVEIKPLKSFADDRGFFRELIRDSDPFFKEGFAQWSHSRMTRNTVKAWHYHHLQIDWWYVGTGLLDALLFDNREESPSYRRLEKFRLGDIDNEGKAAVIKIPTGVLHGCKVLSEQSDLFYITSRLYDPSDEGRLPFDSPVVGYDWGKIEDLVVSERDRKVFVPANPRTRELRP
jgi:dTDP-4-dehydrorhamnose 3,5-epimerase